ncbi:HEAT repeat domain-containing protein [Prosthecobacter sp.]|uniref:HEAT repeat domain-containing protein n=1 Tax=Prosthecobacter sp. TaxID=1965333 RepID=UPI00378402E1
MLLCGFAAQASESRPQMPPEAKPAAWQLAGIEAALKDPDLWVQYHALDYCRGKEWVEQLHFPAAQWLLWLAHPNQEARELAARAATQLGAQMPPEVQRALARLQDDTGAEISARGAATEALAHVGGSMIPEVQLEMAALLDQPHTTLEQRMAASRILGGLGSAMTPATLKALLSLLKNPQAPAEAAFHAAEAVAGLGTSMPPQAREALLGLLLDTHASLSLRQSAAVAMGRLGPQMPPQALELLRTALRDPTASHPLYLSAVPALAMLGPGMPPEVPQALLAAYDAQPPAQAGEDARKDHILFHDSIADALKLAGPGMPPALQQGLLERFLKAAHTPQPPATAKDDFDSMMQRGFLGAELLILAGAGTHVSPPVMKKVLAEFLNPAARDKSRQAIAENFFEPLASDGALPPEIQRTLLATAQDARVLPELRGLAALTLGRLGAGASPEAKQTLLTLLQDPSPDSTLRFYALEAMVALGSHMPPEAAPTLVRMIQAVHAEDSAAPPPFRYELGLVEFAVPALGNLGEQLTPEAQAALLGVIQHNGGTRQTPWDAAYALAQMGDKLSAQTQQRLLALLNTPGPDMDYALRLAIRRTLGVSGLHPVTDAQVADLLAKTYEGEPDAQQRFYFYLWLGRTPAHLQAVRWLGHTDTDPPLGDTPPQEVLSLISRFWPHSTGTDAAHTAQRHAMARRASQILTTSLKTRPLEESTRKVLRTLATQFATDSAPDCAAALKQVQAALVEDVK